MDTPEKRRWYCPTPGWLVFGLLVVEGLLWLSERYRWVSWHKGYAVLIALAVVGMTMLVMLGWFIVSLIFRWRFQFSIRSLLVMVVAVALPCSQLAVEMKRAAEQREAVDGIGKFCEAVVYDHQLMQQGPPGPPWLRRALGDDFFARVAYARFEGTDAELVPVKSFTDLQELQLDDPRVTDGGLSYIEGLTHLQKLLLDYAQITDAGLRHLEQLTELRELSLDNTPIRGEGLKYLEGLIQLRSLGLFATKITDAGLEHIDPLIQLQSLDLCGTEITDAGLEHLKRLAQLKDLRLGSTKVTDAGLEHLEGLNQLQFVSLAATKVTGAGLEHLKGLPKLEVLDLSETKVTDAELLEHLRGFVQLKRLFLLLCTQVTDEGVEKLQQVLPNCEVVR